METRRRRARKIPHRNAEFIFMKLPCASDALKSTFRTQNNCSESWKPCLVGYLAYTGKRGQKAENWKAETLKVCNRERRKKTRMGMSWASRPRRQAGLSHPNPPGKAAKRILPHLDLLTVPQRGPERVWRTWRAGCAGCKRRCDGGGRWGEERRFRTG